MSKHGQSIGPYVPSAQVKLTNVAYVKLQSHGQRFEIACYRNKVLSWKNKVETDIGEVLQIDKVYTNVSRGILASTEHLMEVFGSINQLECCKKILERGEMQVTEQEREALVESTFRDVVAIVADKSVNPETNRSYTTTMIQNAMKQLHINVVTSRSVKAQALEVIRKLKEVMPIARASMALRVVSPIPEEATMKSKIIEDLGLQILKESRTADMVYLDIRIDPEMYKKIEESVQTLTKGQGRVEVTQFRDSAPPALNLGAAIHSKDKQTRKDNNNNESTESGGDGDGGGDGVSGGGGGGGGGADSAAKKPGKTAGKYTKEVDESHQEKNQAAVKSKGEGPDINDSDGSIDEVDDAENAVFEFAKGKNSGSGGGGGGGVSADSGVVKVANKKSKRNKRIEKEEMKEKEKRLIVIRERVHQDQARSSSSSAAATTHQVITESSSEGGVNPTDNTDDSHNNSSNSSSSSRNNSNLSAASSNSSSNSSSSSSNSNNNNNSSSNSNCSEMPATTGGQKCNTCGGSFADAAAYRNHFRSEWHRHNLKRKMKNLPVITSEEDFLKLPIEELEI